jgi:hypothetical protein
MPTARNKALALFREEIQAAHQLVEATLSDVTPEQAHWMPPGRANPIGATYAHIVLSEDATVHGLLRGGAPLFATTWGGRTGVSEPPPAPDPGAPGFPDWSGWSRRVKVELGALRTYALAVYSATDECLGSLMDKELARPLSLAFLGLGESTVRYVLINGLLGNAFTHCGEISCLKGLVGKKGYPF